MPRRLFAAAVAGVVALVALTGCRIESPTDAAYVGNTRYRQADVDRVIKQLDTDGLKVSDTQRGQLSQFIVEQSVFLDVAKRYAAEKGYRAPTVDAAGVAQTNRLPESDPLVQLVAASGAYRDLLLSKATPGKPTDADFHAAFNLLVQQNLVDAGGEAAATQQLRQNFADEMATGVGLRDELTAAMKRYGTTVNPRYLPLGFPLATVPTSSGGNASIVQLPLGGTGQAPVLDLPTSAPGPTGSGETAQ
jgi:hypothetical protein